ncbi:MAG: M23 family metallopeptidase [Bacteroidales bacterium]|nr:M23 family metallopeptidase [Bacteroidales bacterium]
MPKSKYKFDQESLSFNKVEVSFKYKFYKFLTYFFAIFVVAMILNFVLSYFIDFPKEKKLKREISYLLTRYELLNAKLDNISNVLADIQDRDDNIYRVIFEAEPIPNAMRTAGFGGVNRYKELEGYSNSEIIIATTKQLDKIKNQLYIQSKSYDEVIRLAKNKEKMWSCIPAIQPLSNKDIIRFASGFGYRIHPIYKTRRMHTGVDLTAPTGTNIYSTGDGVIIKAGYSRGGYGKRVIIDHGFGYKTLYGHMNKIDVKKGQKIKRGDVIGTIGNTGRSTAPHLHYEVRYKNKAVNPVNFYFNDLTPEEYDKMIEISSQPNQSFD